MNRRFLVAGFSCAWFVTALAGCRREEPLESAPELPVVPVSRPVAREVTDYVYYTGRLDAVQSVDVRPRVTGYLTKMPFHEGTEVKKGELLFEVDPRPYQAQYNATKAQVELYDAAYRLARAENNRSKAINLRAAVAISQEELEKSQTQEAQSMAQLNLAKAQLELAKLNLDFTEITSPIDGRISRYFYTLGNLVTQDSTLLTTIVTVDPMYAYFDMDELTIQRVRESIAQGKIPARQASEIDVNMGLESESGFPHHGRLNFVNNTVTQATGTITVRGVFANPLPQRGTRLLTPRMFVRIQLPVGVAHSALLVIDRALGTDQGVKFLYVVDAQNTIQSRPVTTGALQGDGLRVIESGINADDRVVIGSLQQLRAKMRIDPEDTPMPTMSAADVGPPLTKPVPLAPAQPKRQTPSPQPAKR
jgi:membrane fusion protein, multidrug efflux system